MDHERVVCLDDLESDEIDGTVECHTCKQRFKSTEAAKIHRAQLKHQKFVLNFQSLISSAKKKKDPIEEMRDLRKLLAEKHKLHKQMERQEIKEKSELAEVRKLEILTSEGNEEAKERVLYAEKVKRQLAEQKKEKERLLHLIEQDRVERRIKNPKTYSLSDPLENETSTMSVCKTTEIQLCFPKDIKLKWKFPVTATLYTITRRLEKEGIPPNGCFYKTDPFYTFTALDLHKSLLFLGLVPKASLFYNY